MKSFISEHSAEFILVPQFAAILSSKYRVVVPIYFWVRREGSNISLDCVRQDKLKIVAMYARRPKIQAPGQKNIEIKFNDILFRRADYFQNEGIPVFAGVPNVSDLMDFQIGTKCSWFYIRGDGFGNEEIALLNIFTGEYEDNKLIKPLVDEEVLDYIHQISIPLEWNKAVEIIRSVGKSDNFDGYGFRRFNMYMYKPVYFLLMD